MTYHTIHTFQGWIDRARVNFTLIPTRRDILRAAAYRLAVFFIFLFSIAAAAMPAQAQTFSGQATAVKSTVTVPLLPVTTTAVADTGPLPSAGGNISLVRAGATVPKVLAVGSSNVSTSGGGNSSQSTASVDNLDIGVLSNVITADVISSTTQATCPGQAVTGNSTIAGLQLNNLPITVTGEPNQTIQILVGGSPVGTLIINEQIITPGSITVNALHLFVTDPLALTTTDVVIASAHSGITCVVAPPVNAYSGRGTTVRLRQLLLGGVDLSTIVSDTGFLPTSGGSISVTTAGAGLAPLLTTGAATSATSGGLPGGNVNTSQSAVDVDNLAIDLLGGTATINAGVLTSDTQCQCSLSVPSCTGDSVITDLAVTVLGLPVDIDITGAPNQTITIPVPLLGSITLVINGRESAGPGDITVTALRVIVSLTGLAATDIIISSAHSDINCSLIPTAGDASISGRVTDAAGRGIPRAMVKLTNMTGVTRTGMTNSFGYYRLEEIPAGEAYTAEAIHKRYSFAPRVVMVEDDIAGLDFVAEEPGQANLKR